MISGIGLKNENLNLILCHAKRARNINAIKKILSFYSNEYSSKRTLIKYEKLIRKLKSLDIRLNKNINRQ